MSKGKFIVIEGSEGAGKSTMVNEVKKYLMEHGVSEENIILTREPGGTPLAEKMRNILKEIDERDVLCPESELLLMYAARVQLVNTVIIPALNSGKYVIGDRHDLSTVAYQGGGRGISRTQISTIRNAVLGDFYPDLTLLMDLDQKIGLERAGKRGAFDRFEQEKIDFFQRVRAVFLEEAKKNPDRIKIINAEPPVSEVTAMLRKVLESSCIIG